jgi:hypothetical protein
MKVILDTNIFQTDYRLKSGRFEILLDYLQKTDWQVVLPRIVYQELRANYERELRGRLSKYGSASGALNALLDRDAAPSVDVSIESEVDSYLEELMSKLDIAPNEIMEYSLSYVETVVEQAVRRRRPCNENGEEIRDAILWQMVLDTAAQSERQSVVFVSGNTRQFGSAGSLHPVLLEDCRIRGVEVRYFSSLEEFAKDHATRVTLVTEEWLRKHLPLDEAVERARDYIEKSVERYAETAVDYGEPTGHVNMVGASVDVESFFAYEMADGSLKVETTLSGETEVEVEVGHRAHHSEYDDDWDYETEHLHPEVTLKVDATVRDEEITGWNVVDVALQ